RSSCVGVGDGVQPTGVGVDADHGPVTVAQAQGCGGFPLVVEAVHLVEFDAVPAAASAAMSPPGALMAPICAGSLTSTILARAWRAIRVRVCRSKVDAIDASSTTSTVRALAVQAACSCAGSCASRACWCSHLASVSALLPVAFASSAAARADGANPTTW